MSTNIPSISIASRRLELGGQECVEVRIFLPEKVADDEYKCPFSIDGLADNVFAWATGADEIQSIVLSLQKMGVILYSSVEFENGSLTWLGSRDLGFPTPIGFR